MWSAERWSIGLSPAGVELLRAGAPLVRQWIPGQARNDGEGALVTPANAGVQRATGVDSGVRRNDGAGAERLLAAMDELLAEQSPRGRRVEVVVRLSSHLVRFALLPWQDELVTPREIALAARHRIDRLYGEAAVGDRVWVDQSGWGEPGVVCAVNAALLDGIAARLDSPPFRLAVVEPALLSLCNVLGKGMRDGGIALVEPGRIGIASFVGGRWQSLVARRAGSDGGVLALRQEMARLDVSPAPSDWLIQPVGDELPSVGFPGRVLPAVPLAGCGEGGGGT